MRRVILPIRSALAPPRGGPHRRPPPPPPPPRRSTSTTTTTAARGRIVERTPPRRHPPGIFPMHVLGCGPVGLLYASAMIDAARDDEMRGSSGAEAGDRGCDDVDDRDDHGGGGTGPPVTLLLRPHHESRLGRRPRPHPRSGGDDADDDPDALIARVVVRRPPPSGHDGGAGVVASRRDVPSELLTTTTTTADCGGPIRCLLLCTKATDAIDALGGVWERLLTKSSSSASSEASSEAVRGTIRDPARVIILSNGALAIRDAMYDRFGGGGGAGGRTSGVRVVLGTTTHGAYRNRPSGEGGEEDGDCCGYDFVGHYDITHAGIGSTSCADVEFVDACRSIGWDATHCEHDGEMDAVLWRKLAANCVINPLTAIRGVRNGGLLDAMTTGWGEGDEMRTIAMGLLEEVSAVATAEMRRRGLMAAAESLSVPSLEEFVLGVMSATRENASSMLQDVEAGRTTEVRFLNGYVSSVGRERHGTECPRNDDMCRLVEELKSSSCASVRGI